MSNNFVVRHWRGEYSLPVSYWLIGILLSNLATAALYGGMLEVERISYSQNLMPPAVVDTLWIFLMFLALALLVWVSTGIWRSARAYQYEKPKRRFWGTLAKAAVVAAWIGFFRGVVEGLLGVV